MATSKAADRSVRSTDAKMPGILTNAGHLFLRDFRGWLDSRYVLGLPALGAFGHVETDGLALLQALEAA